MGLAAGGGIIASWGSLAACSSLSETSPIPTGDSSDIDTGFVRFPEDTDTPPAPTVDAGPPPPSGRVRFANFLQGAGAVDLCARPDPPTGPWVGRQITNPATGTARPEGLRFGEVSSHFFLDVPVGGSTGQRYQFRVVPVGGSCEPEGGAPLAAVGPTAIRQGGGITIVAMGVVAEEGTDAGDALARGVAQPDILNPSATALQLRAFHGVPDLPAFDIVINGETFPNLTGIKYGSSLGHPYTSSNGGFQSIPAGVPEGATLTFRAGTSARNYTIPGRLRRGVATTIFVGGSFNQGKEPLTVTLCSDRSPPEGETLATCEKLQAQGQ